MRVTQARRVARRVTRAPRNAAAGGRAQLSCEPSTQARYSSVTVPVT